jgi:hypothetical protein
MSFSQRIGLKPARKAIQLDGMDDDLRNSLWSVLTLCFWNKFKNQGLYAEHLVKGSNLDGLITAYWLHLFKEPVDAIPESYHSARDELRRRFFKLRWHEVYDFLEVTLGWGPTDHAKSFRNSCNTVLEREIAGYRLVNGQVTPITSDDEIQSIEDAIAGPFTGASKHLATALSLFSDRKTPDYRNSIKESISAVEAMARILTGDDKATLGEALKKLDANMHPALHKSLNALYGYTSDEGGIRHSMLDEPDLGSTEARFMLVVCSAFVNYMVSKAGEVGLKLE